MSPPRARPGAAGNLSVESPNRGKEGRTPPPAPSAAYARRAREIQQDEQGVEYSSGGMGMEEGDGNGESQYGIGYRRARAGTMPSKLPEPSHFVPLNDEPTPTMPASFAAAQRTSALSPAYPDQSPVRPTLRHTTSSAAELESPTTSRHRSGSLSGVGPFSTSAFSNAWLANPGLTSGPTQSSFSQAMNSDSYTSPMHSNESLTPDDLQFSTLGYLGLAEGGDGGNLPPASVSELRNSQQRAIASSGPASRLRASTVSNFARPQNFRPSVTSSSPYQDNSPYDIQHEAELQQAIEQLSMYDHTPQQQYDGGFLYHKDSNRPRATTISGFDGPSLRGPQAGFLASIPQSPIQGHLGHPFSINAYGYPPRSHSERDLLRSRDSSASRGPRMSISSHTSRTGTPDVGGSSTPQMPTRSLWIGNLDVNAMSDTLLHVFAPYGAIESVRMLPEKTCAFVNFMEKTDAIRARDDVLNRLGGHIPALSETAPVRIGFGKIDSAPNGLAQGAGIAPPVAPSSNLVFTNGPIGAVTVPPQFPDNVQSVNVSPENQSEHSSLPTRALWIGSIPGTTSSATLLQIFSPFGPVESARVLMHKCCGFINFERLDSAVSARNALNGRDMLGSDVGPIRIGFARVPTKTPIIGGPENEPIGSPEKLGEGLNAVKGATSVSTEQQLSAEGGGVENFRSPLILDLVKAGVPEQIMEKGLAKGGVVSDQQMIMQVLSGGKKEEDGDVYAAADSRPAATYYTAIPIITDRQQRRFDSGRLKELRKRLDSGQCSDEEINELAMEMLEDCAELSSDYIGNTVIQKLYERVEPGLRRAMLERIAPHLAMIGIHKNGTWAAQKVIECSITDEERYIITEHLKPFAPPLMCDSLGNYVCAGTLRFGPPFNDYVFDAMLDRMWDVAQNRFGARCMRTCLENPNTTLYQKKRIATGVILNAIPLSTNPNGALLLTWLVDTSNLPGRYALLANRFAPHIAHLCTHKLASLTVLRIITQNIESTASTTLTAAIFESPSDQTLIEILSDANNGCQVIGKILATATLPMSEKDKAVEAVRRVLPSIKASSTPPYRMLLEAVGLPVPAGSIGPSPFGRGGSNLNPQNNWQGGNNNSNNYMSGGYYPYQQPIGGGNGLGNGGLTNLTIPMSGSGNSPLHSAGASPSPRTPQPRQRGRMSPAHQMMSPGSDPFNPFASPSVDMSFTPRQSRFPHHNGPGGRGGNGNSFEQQPNFGGLGIMGQQGMNGMYYQQQNMPYTQAGYQA